MTAQVRKTITYNMMFILFLTQSKMIAENFTDYCGELQINEVSPAVEVISETTAIIFEDFQTLYRNYL